MTSAERVLRKGYERGLEMVTEGVRRRRRVSESDTSRRRRAGLTFRLGAEAPMMWQQLLPFVTSLEDHDRSLKACFVVLVVHGLCSSECE